MHVRKPSLRLLILGAMVLAAPLGAYRQLTGAAEAHGTGCPYAQAAAAAAEASSGEALPVGVSLFDAARSSPEIFP